LVKIGAKIYGILDENLNTFMFLTALRNIVYIYNNAKETECPETSARNYHSTLRNNPEERRAHLPRDRSLKSRDPLIIFHNNITVFNC
jgi:hypothetical protein